MLIYWSINLKSTPDQMIIYNKVNDAGSGKPLVQFPKRIYIVFIIKNETFYKHVILIDLTTNNGCHLITVILFVLYNAMK
jgi:hypothetical protein